MTYWKATHTDGTDFHTGTVDYAAALASGEPLPELSGKGPFPGLGWYHLATVPTECVGMSWPCRLFEVEPADDLGEDRPRHEHKVGATAVRVLAEVDAHVALGPQGVQVAAFIERCATLTEDDVARLGAAWGAATRGAAGDATRVAAGAGVAWEAARDAAWNATRDAAWEAAWGAATRDAAWEAARDAAWNATRDGARGAAWDAAWGAAGAGVAWGAARDAASGAARDAAWEAAWGAATRDAAWEAAREAARGLLLRDLIGQRHGWDQDAYDLLTGPWRRVIGPAHPDDKRGAE